MEHPFEDSAKLRILNSKYTIPESDTKYTVFHDLISKYMISQYSCKNFFSGKKKVRAGLFGLAVEVDEQAKQAQLFSGVLNVALYSVV